MGANEKVFERLNLDGYNLNFIDWIIPHKNEAIEDYAKRMSKNIDTRGEVILIGLSFGGIMVQEIAKLIETNKIVIISSIKNRNELPALYKISSTLKLHKLIPSFFFHNTKILSKLLFGKNSESLIRIMERFFTMRDIRYSKWAMDIVVNWKESSLTTDLLHIHGTKDTVFPAKHINNAIFVEDGTHLMIFNKATTVSKHILNFLKKQD